MHGYTKSTVEMRFLHRYTSFFSLFVRSNDISHRSDMSGERKVTFESVPHFFSFFFPFSLFLSPFHFHHRSHTSQWRKKLIEHVNSRQNSYVCSFLSLGFFFTEQILKEFYWRKEDCEATESDCPWRSLCEEEFVERLLHIDSFIRLLLRRPVWITHS